MNTRRNDAGLTVLLAIVAILGGDSSAVGLDPALEAKRLLETARVQGGLVVHVGCGDGTLTAALRANDSYLVHGLDTDAKHIDAARKHLQSLGRYGKVAVEHWDGKRLPYGDNLANLVVVSGPSSVSKEELLRVLCPNGVAIFLTTDNGPMPHETLIKPWPPDIDQWTHFLHDAGNNAVAHDTRVGAPRSLQWSAAPLWLRSHETPSGVQAMVSGGGRLFYVFDEGLIGITDQRLPERWAVLCRDAFNGTLLWRRPLEQWGWPQWANEKFAGKDWTTIAGGRTVVPNENQRRLVVDGARLYATLSYNAPLSILDAATGKTLATVAETAPARQILVADGVAVVHSQTAISAPARRKATAGPAAPGALLAVSGATGAVLWRQDVSGLRDLALAIDRGRVIYLQGSSLGALDLKTGQELWSVQPPEKNLRTLVARDGLIVMRSATVLATYDGATGRRLWQTPILGSMGIADQDLFVIQGVVWPGVTAVNDEQEPQAKGDNVVAIGYDLRTGEERQRVFAEDILSPEHHHRCYRNKATDRFVITSMEGAEFIDLQGRNHSQNNFVRGACKLGMMPCNGMLYVPPDQCFCQPGAKLLGFAALTPETPAGPIPDAQRLVRGPAFAGISDRKAALAEYDWPTYRHDPARHGTTTATVGAALQEAWRVRLGGRLTAPVAVGDRVYVAARDAHTVYALNLRNGETDWQFVADGPIDSPPTVTGGRVLCGSADGWVYCLRATDGVLAWRFLAAPSEKRIVCFGQLESRWPVHGSVLVHAGVVYVAAGRSTYLDGGIRLYALEPATGKMLHQTTLAGPFPDGQTVPRDVAFFARGANSDVLVAEGDAIYMRQKRLTGALHEVAAEVLSSKGEADVGRHVFSTAGLLDDSWYNRTFWMYANRWPGFQLANQAPKSGQLLVVDDANTYAVSVFYRRNLHTTMFFPGKEGYLLFADKNSTEPQIVGAPGARRPVAWLPQSDYQASNGLRPLDSQAFGVDKGTGYTRAEPPLWTLWLPVRVRAMVKAGNTLFVAGPPDALDAADPYASFEGRNGARLLAVSAQDGKQLAEHKLDAPPVFDGLIAVPGKLLLALGDGSLACWRAKP